MPEPMRVRIVKVENGYETLFDTGEMYLPKVFVGMEKADMKAAAMNEIERRVDLMLEDL